MEMLVTELLKLGAVGIMILALGWYAKKQIDTTTKESEYMKKSILDNLQKQVESNEVLENEFREYLKERNKELSDIIQKNTHVLERVLDKLR